MARKAGKSYCTMLDLGQWGLPEVPLFGAYRFKEAVVPLDFHSHEAYEICYLMEGRQNYRVKGRDYLLRDGDVFITRPEEGHSSGARPQEKGALYWMHVLPVKDKESFLGLERKTAAPILNSLGEIKRRCFRGSRRMKDLLENIHVLLSSPRSPLTKPQMCGLLISLLIETVRCSRLPEVSGKTDLNAAIRYIDENLESPLRVPAIAAKLGLSVSWFKARFKRDVGMSPAEYVMRCRIEKARLFLEKGEGNVTEAAMRFGFSSSQHFAFAFKKLMHKKPSEAVKSKQTGHWRRHDG